MQMVPLLLLLLLLLPLPPYLQLHVPKITFNQTHV
jgi:hypothetical protein